ncbi:MAG TPA: hypothetical protein VGE92_00090 [Steroidobacteraceae bacterium]
MPLQPSLPLPPVAVHCGPDEFHVSVTGVLIAALIALAEIDVGGGACTVTFVDACTTWLPVPQVIEYVKVPAVVSITGIDPAGEILLPPQLTPPEASTDVQGETVEFHVKAVT